MEPWTVLIWAFVVFVIVMMIVVGTAAAIITIRAINTHRKAENLIMDEQNWRDE